MVLARISADDLGFALLGAIWLGLSMGMGYWIGRDRGRGAEGAVLGLFAPIGWLIILFVPRTLEAEARRLLAVEKRKKAIETAAKAIKG